MAERCWRCGAETTDAAAFCDQCGAKVRADAPDLEFFTDVAPAPPAPVEAASTDGSRWLLVAGVGLVAALVAFFALTSADDTPSADPYEERADFEAVDAPEEADTAADGSGAPTSTIPLTFGEVLAPLSWSIVRDQVEGYPLALVELDRSIFVYATELAPFWSVSSSGARAFQYTSGGDWIDHGLVIEADAQVNAIAVGDDGLLATGLSGAGEPVVWRSDDGTTWRAEQLPGTAVDGFAWRPAAIAERDGVVVVASSPIDPWQQVTTAVYERFGPDVIGINGHDWSPDTDDVTVRGPFGLQLASVPLDELGLDADLLDDGASRPQPSPIWVYDQGAWASNVVTGQVTTLTTSADGGIHLAMSTDSGEISTYRHGTWRPRAADTNLFGLQPWNDGFVGRGDADRLAFLDADFGLVSETLPPGLGVGDAVLDTFATGPLGLMVSSRVWDSEATEALEDSAVVVLRDGYRLEVGPVHLLQVSRDGEELVRANAWSSDSDGYRADLDCEEPSIIFLDPETGEDLVAFTLAEMRELEAEVQPQIEYPDQAISMLFSPDGQNWLGGEVDLIDSSAPALVVAHVGSERLYTLIVTLRQGAVISAFPDIEFALLQVEPRGQ